MKNVRHILNEGFDRLFETKKVIKESAPDAPLTEKQRQIARELLRTVNALAKQGASIKEAEVALQDVIERYFPDHEWWEVCDCDIFTELLKDAHYAPINIVKSIRKEFIVEEKEYGFEDCEDEECNESADNGLTRSEEFRFVSALYSALQKEPYGYSAEEAHEIAMKRAEDLDPSWRVRWNNDLDAQIRQELKYTATKAEYDAELGEGKCNESVGDRVAEYQKWVDYDMKKYGKISGKTMGILKREGFTVVKDEYGDLEVIPEEKDRSSIKESKESDVKGWWDEVEKWNAENGNKYTIENDDADVEDMRVAMWDMLMELKGVAPELYEKGKKIYNKYRVFTKITEGKLSNKRTFRYDVGDNKYSFYCETEDTRYGFRHLCSMFLRGQEVGDSVKKYYNRTWEMFTYQSALLSAVENSSVSEEDKKSLEAQINEGEGLREGKQCEDVDDDDISDDEYYAELEKHIAEIPSYDDEKLKAEYKEFKDSTHEDDIRVETALKDEMIKRGFIRLFKSAKESVDESKQLNEGASNFWTMSKLPLLIFDDDEAVYDKLRDAARLELGKDASDEEVSDKVEELYDGIDYCTLVDEEIDGLKQDVEDFNRENSDTKIKVEIKPGYYEAYQLYCNDKELSDEEVGKVAKFFDEMKKKYYLTALKVAYRASNGETGYSIVKD